jgi:class 3 adenylate cyclase/Tfp pilus assembly protein PilF
VNETESKIRPSTDILSIAGWKIHSSRNLIEKGEQSVRLQPRTMAVLTRLVESPGEVVTRQQLEDAAWPNMVVGYDALSHTITKLRKAFDDDPKNPRLIETIPKVGYRLIAEISHTSLDGESPPGAKRLEPRLAVILHADVVDSTSLVQINETLAHERIQNAFQRFSETISAHHGIAHEIRGDALVAEFNRASDCLLAALSFQAENQDFVNTIADDIQVQLRIGISMGEVVIADGTVTGAGVVLAQRLEQMAGAGGVCIQGAAYETVPTRLPFNYESLGEKQVKGFEEPVRVYSVRLKPEEIDTAEKLGDGSEPPMVRAGRRRLRIIGVTALLILAGIGINWWQPWVQNGEQASIERMPDTPKSQEPKGSGSIGRSNAAAHNAYLEGLSSYRRNTPADNAKAETHFKRAIELDPDFKSAYAALARAYYKGIETEYSNAMLLSFSKSMFLAHKNLSRSVGAKSADGHILRSRIALSRHQIDVALLEVERALEISADDADALNLKARALVYSGQYAEARKLASRIKRLDPAVIAEPLYITGLSYFASGSYDKAADYVEQALANDDAPNFYNLLLAAAYGKLGKKTKAKDALQKYRETWFGPFWMAVAVYFFPFENGEVLKHLADGLESAGVVVRPPSRYLKLDREARLSGQQIETLLFGHTIKGSEFQIGGSWEQTRTTGGKVSHTGVPIHIGNNPDGHNLNKGESWIEDDRLCNRWFDEEGSVTSCAHIFRDLDGDQDNYYMVTDFGPNQFQVTN